MVKESNRVLNGEYLMIMRGTFDRLVMERLSDHTHFTDEIEGFEKFGNVPKCIQLVSSPKF